MGGGFEKKPGGSSLVQPAVSSGISGTPGKRTLTEQLLRGPVHGEATVLAGRARTPPGRRRSPREA
jgi:hypothetical protein